MRRKLFVAFPVYKTGAPLHDFLLELGATIPLLQKLGMEVKCIAVNDATPDRETLGILENPPIQGLEVINRSVNGGCCEALVSGLEYVANRSQTEDMVAWLDADGEHRPTQLIGLTSILERGAADLALSQIVWREGHMEEYDRLLQWGMGALEAKVIFGDERRWVQHCPGCWVVSAKYLVLNEAHRVLRNYLDFYHKKEGKRAQWGEDMTFVACVHHLGGRVDDSTITTSHMPAPNRPPTKVVSQYTHALAHLGYYGEFFGSMQTGN